MTKHLYDTKEVAATLSVCLATAKSLIASGELRSVKIGRARRIPATAIEDYLNRLDRAQNGTK